MNEQVKKYLIIGGAIIAAIVLGVIAYRKFQNDSSASQAASDQASQDELAYIESMALSGGYAGAASTASAIALPTAAATPSLTDELASIEQAFGLTPPSSPSAPGGSGSTSSPTSSGTNAASSPSPSPAPAAPSSKGVGTTHQQLVYDAPPVMAEEGVAVA